MDSHDAVKVFKATINRSNAEHGRCGFCWCLRANGHDGMHWRPWDRARKPHDVNASDDLIARVVLVRFVEHGPERQRY